MATGITSNDREFLFRIQTQIVDGGTDVLRNIFDQKLQNMPLKVFLANEKTSINRLRGQKTITKTQYGQLFPPRGQLPTSVDFDITLLICLLRNLQSLGLNQNYSWNVVPQPTDTSTEADLCRLKGFRNEVAHISSTTGFNKTSFQNKWTDIEQVLLRLNTAVTNALPNLQQTLDIYKHSSLEPIAEQRIQADIERWREMEKALEKEMQLIKTDVKELKQDVKDVIKNVNELEQDVQEVTGRVEVLAKNVIDANNDVTTKVKESNKNVAKVTLEVENVKEMITEFKEELGEVKKDVKTVTGGFHSLKKDLCDDIAEVKGNVQKVTEDVRKVKNLLTNKNETSETDKIKDSRHRKKTGLFQRMFWFVFPSRRLKDFQDDLISFYRDQHSTILLSPLLENDTPLLEFYVMPDIYSLKVQRTRSDVTEVKTAVTPLRNVFYNDDKMCRKIYLTADAGLGKTAFSKRLALTWCHAKKPLTYEGQYFVPKEIRMIDEFRVVFLLLLRNCSSECEIDDIILNQIISQLPRSYSREFIENILFKERCLVILDGLDEWNHPLNSCKQGSSPIPHQKVRDRTTVLTTSRPWKLSVSGLQSSQIDQKLELVGLNQKSAKALKRSVISHLFHEKNKRKLDNYVTEFTSALKEKQFADLESIPLLLMYLLFLWCNKIELGHSQCNLYSQITELLVSRTVKNCFELLPKVDLPQGDIPQCFGEKTHCKQFVTLLTALGQLAYQTLFRETREENTLVFDGSVAERYLNKDCLNFCLKTGLITQSKVPGTLLEQKSKVSFAHKTVQEFFAALYMHSTADQTSLPKIVLSKCESIQDILEMSNILLFICAMNVNVSSLISHEMGKIINEDEITREYRSSLESYSLEYRFSHPLKDYQDMCISCCKEIPRANDVSLCLLDVFIDRSCLQEQYRENLKQLTTRNKQNIRSLSINMEYIPYSSVQKVIDYFALSDLGNVEKIHYPKGKYNDRDILPLLNKSVKCLHLSCGGRGSWSRLLCEKVTSLQKLEAIHIGGFEMSHSELILLYEYISQRHCMRKIELWGLYCRNHGKSCTGFLDLSKLSQLKTLTLGGAYISDSIPVSELNINMASLEKCRLLMSSNPDLVLSFINCVQVDSKLNTFECSGLKSPVAIETMLETLRLSGHVKHVLLCDINLGNREVLSSEVVNIEHVELWEVTMTASVLQGIVDVVQQQPQTVTVNILTDCAIIPESEFVTVKQNIKTSREHFRVVEDSDDLFRFESIKQGD